MGVVNAQRQADLLKDKGNQYFKKEKLGAAIEAYTEAITLCPRVPVYWTNRALCERKRNEWEKVEADCRRALELDNQSVKAHYMLGLALLQYQQYEEAVKQLEKALDLGRGATGNYMVEEIWQELSKARLAEWDAVADLRQRQQLDLKLHLADLLRVDYERQLAEAIASIKAAASAAAVIGVPQDGQKAAQAKQEVEDLIRLEDDNTNAPEEKDKRFEIGLRETDSDGRVQFMPIYTDVELDRLYRTRSEPPKGFLKEGSADLEQATSSPFDPLKQHKLSLRRGSSLSIRRQRSQPVGVPEDMDGNPKSSASGSPIKREAAAAAAAAASEIAPQQSSAAAAAAAVESTSNSTTKAADNEPPKDFHSIYDVYKVFKEFMKLHHNDAGHKLLRVSELFQRRGKILEDVFERVGKPDRVADIPDHLCCKITMDIFRDPVITTSGITYERAAILDHLRKVGKFDPFTRAPLTADQIVPNLALKEAVQIYLDEHGWAYGPV